MVTSLLAGAGVAAAGWLSVEYAWWRPAVSWRQTRVLMYHMVQQPRPGARFNKLRVAPRMFTRQVAWLRQEGFQFVFASQLFSREPLPERSVCITFDDGYADNSTAADPILAEHGAVATLYLVADRSGGWSSRKKAHHGDEELQAEPKLTDDQVRKMLASGRWELGGHTRTHAYLPALNVSEARREIASAREDFEKLFGAAPATFAYPFGIFQPEHAQLVAEAGFVGAVTTEPGIAQHPIAEPMQVPRIKVSGKDSLLAFRLRMRGGKRGLLK